MTRIKVKSAKDKARKLQQDIAKRISKLLNIPYGNEDDKLIQSRQMGQSGTDVILRGEAKEKFPFAIECKSAQKFSLLKTIKQVKDNLTSKDRRWLIFYKRKEIKKSVVIMETDLFFELLEELEEIKKELNYLKLETNYYEHC